MTVVFVQLAGSSVFPAAEFYAPNRPESANISSPADLFTPEHSIHKSWSSLVVQSGRG